MKYFKVDVLSLEGDVVHKYVTEGNLNNYKVLNDTCKLLNKIHGDDVIIAWNEVGDSTPQEDIDKIIPAPEEPLKYNK